MSLIREYIRSSLIAEYSHAPPGKRNIYRGMKITMPSAKLAGLVRKYVRTRDASAISPNELARLVFGQLQNESIGESWSLDFGVAANFAGAWEATNRGKELYVIFQAVIDEEAGYDPQAADEEPGMFYDESEVRFKPGTEIPLTGIYVFIKSKNQYAKQRSQYFPLIKKVQGNPMMVKA